MFLEIIATKAMHSKDFGLLDSHCAYYIKDGKYSQYPKIEKIKNLFVEAERVDCFDKECKTYF